VDDFEEYYRKLQGQVNSETPPKDDGFNQFYDNLRMDTGVIPDTRTKPDAASQPLPEVPAAARQLDIRFNDSLPEPIKKPFLAQIQSDIYDNTIGPVADKLMRFAVSSVDALSPGDDRARMQQAPDYQRQIFGKALEPAQTTADEVADFAGSMYGATPSILGAYKIGGKVLNKLGSKLPANLTSKLTSTIDDIGRVNGIGNASNLAGMAARGASAGTVYGHKVKNSP
jgi:hypothetical protein